jgi:hypothetical protein
MFGLHLRVTSSHPAVGRGLLIGDDTTTPVLLGGPTENTEPTNAEAIRAEVEALPPPASDQPDQPAEAEMDGAP